MQVKNEDIIMQANKETPTVSLDRRRDVSKNPLCLSGKGVTREFHAGGTHTIAVNNVDFEFHVPDVNDASVKSWLGITT